MDPFAITFETVMDGGVEAGAAPSPDPAAPPAGAPSGEPTPPAGATDTAPAWTPDQIQALRDMPEFQDMFASEASTIAEARFAQLLEQARGQQQPQLAQPGQPLNINEFLDPMGENFGQNLLTVLGMVGQNVNQTVNGALEPFQQQAQAAQAAAHDELLTTAITDTAATLGGLKGGDAAVQRVIQAVRSQFMPEAMRTYGQTDRAAQVAIDRAVRAEHAYQAQVSGTQAAEAAQHLATVNGAPAVTANGSAPAGVTAINGEVLRGQSLVQKYGALADAINRR